MICQPPRVPLHLSDDGTVGRKKLWWRRCVTDEVAKVDAGHKGITVSAGQGCRAAFSKVGLQPFEDFFLCFHGSIGQNNFFHHGNHLATVPSNSNGGSTVRRKPCSQ